MSNAPPAKSSNTYNANLEETVDTAEQSRVETKDATFLMSKENPAEFGTIGGYRIKKVLGKGGMGLVLLAEDEKLKRKVALKVMLPELSANEIHKKRFMREAEAAAAIEHDHIIPIYQVGEDGNTPFLAMKLLKGKPLDEFMKKSPKLPPELVRIWSRQIALGLAAAHERGLVHRDIKPANIFLEDSEGEDNLSRVRILDFGLARPMDEDLHLTGTGVVVGTPAYMSPEQARGKNVTASSDLFSLGVMMYQMATGMRPFTGDTTIALMSSLALDTPTAPNVIDSTIPADLSNLIMSLLEKDPAKRPASARAVAKSLAGPVAPTIIKVEPLENEFNQAFVFDDPPAPAKKPAAKKSATQKPPVKKTPTKSAKVIALPPKKKNRLGLWIAAGFLFLIIGSYATFEIVLKTPNGNLVLTVNDPDTEAKIKNGEIHILDKEGKTRYVLKPSERNKKIPVGEYLIEVSGADGVKFDTKEFKIEKGKDKVVKAFFEKSSKTAGGATKDSSTSNKAPEAKTREWVSLFNGKDLTGWKTHPDQPGDWKVEDGILVGRGPKKNLLFSERGDYEDFHFRVECKINKAGNSGQMLRYAFTPTVSGDGYEIQIDSGNHANRTGTIYRGGTPLVAITEILVPPDTWFTQEVIARGNRITVLVDGKQVADCVDPENTWKKGHLALQVFDEPTDVRFRKIEVKELTSRPTNGGPNTSELTPLFNGKDLTGWEKVGPTDWTVKEGILTTVPGQGPGWLATAREYADFELKLEYRIAAGGNSGVFLRAWKDGPIDGGQFMEIQIVDDQKEGTFGKVNGTAALFGIVAAKPPAESVPDTWHKMVIRMQGRKLQVSHDGKSVIDTNLDDHAKHFEVFPGMKRTAGRIGLQHFGTLTEFRNIEIKDLSDSADADRKAAEWVLSIGGKITIERDGVFREVTMLKDFQGASYDKVGIQFESNNKVTDAGLDNLKGFTKPLSVGLVNTAVTSEGLKRLQTIPNLKSLDFSLQNNVDNTGRLGDKGADYLRTMTNLETLVLSARDLNDSQLAKLTTLANLKNLHIHFNGITDAGLKNLKAFPNLTGLLLQANRITDNGLEDLKALPKLDVLFLGINAISDAGLTHLYTMANLKLINIAKTKVTAEGVKKLAAALPKCKIESDFGTFEPISSEKASRRAAEWVTKAGGSVKISTEGNSKWTDKPEELPKEAFVLDEVGLRDRKFAEEGLSNLQGLGPPIALTLAGSSVTDEGLERLNTVPIRYLDLHGTQISDRGLKHLEANRELHDLILTYTHVTDEGLQHVKKMDNLVWLVLNGTAVTDKGMDAVSNLKGLGSLNLADTKVGDAGLIPLKRLTELNSLHLDNTQVTDAGLEHLRGLTKLRKLLLYRTKVTAEGVKKLQEALPECKIESDFQK